MAEELKKFIKEFGGQAKWTCCFDHIINLVIKSITWQFDVQKKGNNDVLSEALNNLMALAENLEEEEEALKMSYSDDPDDNDDDNSWIDKWNEMTDEKVEDLEWDVVPVKHVLVKVHWFVDHCTHGVDMTTAWLCMKIHFSHSFVNIKNIMLAPFTNIFYWNWWYYWLSKSV